MTTQIQIVCAHHGVAGASVFTTHENLLEILDYVKQTNTKKECRKLHAYLKKELSRMLPDIVSKGKAKSSDGDIVTKDDFNEDLICLAIYDHVGNDKQIGIFIDDDDMKH